MIGYRTNIGLLIEQTRMAQFIKSSTDINATAGNVKDPDEVSRQSEFELKMCKVLVYENCADRS
jgi:hypothetical protein